MFLKPTKAKRNIIFKLNRPYHVIDNRSRSVIASTI